MASAPSFQARSLFSSQGSLVDPRLRASNEHILIVCVPRARRAPWPLFPTVPSLLVISQGWGLIDLPLRATFSPSPPTGTPRRAISPCAGLLRPRVARAQKINSLHPLLCSNRLLRGVAEAALYCAHRTSTVSSCAFCEQEGHLATPRLPS